MAIQDPIATLTPGQRQELGNASGPIGTVTDASRELDQLETRTAQLQASVKRASITYRSETSLPESVSGEARRPILEAAEHSLSSVETAARLDSLDQTIPRDYAERTGDSDIYGFLWGMK
jgi:hypothetical protein